MPRITVEEKAVKYLASARITVTFVDGDVVRARAHGDGELYELGHDPDRSWWCSCPARGQRCAHLVGLRLITVRSSTTHPKETSRR